MKLTVRYFFLADILFLGCHLRFVKNTFSLGRRIFLEGVILD